MILCQTGSKRVKRGVIYSWPRKRASFHGCSSQNPWKNARLWPPSSKSPSGCTATSSVPPKGIKRVRLGKGRAEGTSQWTWPSRPQFCPLLSYGHHPLTGWCTPIMWLWFIPSPSNTIVISLYHIIAIINHRIQPLLRQLNAIFFWPQLWLVCRIPWNAASPASTVSPWDSLVKSRLILIPGSLDMGGMFEQAFPWRILGPGPRSWNADHPLML